MPLYNDIVEWDNIIRTKYAGHVVEMLPDEEHGTVWVIFRDGCDPLVITLSTLTAHTHPDVLQRLNNRVATQPNDDAIVGEIYDWLRARHPTELARWDHNPEERNVIVYGLVQSGKTNLILSMAWVSQHVYRTKVVLVLSNMLDSYNQVLRKSVREFNDALIGRFGEERVSHFLIKSRGYQGRNAPRVDDDDHTWLRVVMGNASQLRRFQNTIRGEFDVLCDEGDTLIKGVDEESDQSKMGEWMKTIKARASFVANITATPLACWNEKNVVNKTISMNVPENYRGEPETAWCYSTDEEADKVRRGDADQAIAVLQEMVDHQRPIVEPRSRYVSILVNAPHQIASQDRLALSIKQARPDWGVYVMNSGGFQGQVKEATQTGIRPSGVSTISALYDRFEAIDSRGFKIYVIVACQRASRAISFRPTTTQNGTGGLHGMIFFPSPGCHAAQLIQYMRVWGKYAHDYPKIRVRTTEDVHHKLRNEIAHNLRRFAEANQEAGLSREQIEGVPVVDIGCRHDRPAVDDTCVADKTHASRQEFDTQEELRAHLAAEGTTNFVVMTERFLSVRKEDVRGGFRYGLQRGAAQNQMRHALEDALPANVPTTQGGFQVCWNNARYEQLHTISSRYNESGQYNCRVVAGSGGDDGEYVNVVVWKLRYCKHDDPTLDWTLGRFQPNSAYLFQTTKGTWRYYTAGIMPTHGVLAHRN